MEPALVVLVAGPGAEEYATRVGRQRGLLAEAVQPWVWLNGSRPW